MGGNFFKKMKAFGACVLLTQAPMVLGQEDAQNESLREAKRPANEFIKVMVPGANCGLGDDYRVFIREGRTEKVAFALQGGGACWSKETCNGTIPMTQLRPVEELPYDGGLYNGDAALSPLSDYTIVFFPYCTGDVHMGKHQARYDGLRVDHFGSDNIATSLRFLQEQGHVDFDAIENFVAFGHSAGAIGSLAHLPTFDGYLPVSAKKVIISDSPGMHFGRRFWKKFPQEQLDDYSDHFSDVALKLNPKDGFVAKQLDQFCGKFPHWNIGILQSTRDFVMSTVFGNITPLRHKRMVMSDEGLYGKTKDPQDNCSSWIYEGGQHTFLSFDEDAELNAGNMTAIQYARQLVETDDMSSQTDPESKKKKNKK